MSWQTLNEMGHQVSHALAGRLLHQQGYSMQANAKINEGGQHPDRDAQFNYLNEQVREHLAEGAPVLSVDTKKNSRTVAVSGSPKDSRWQSMCTTFPTTPWAR